MKNMLLAFFSTLIYTLSAQITVTNATFWGAGDTLSTAFDATPDLSGAITPPGGSQIWDFTSLKASTTTETVYLPTSAGDNASQFPSANFLLKGNANETYYKKSNNALELIGYAGLDPANLGLQVTAKFAPPIVNKRAPMNFFDINQTSSDLSVPFSTEQLPDSLIPIPFVDSIRIRVHYDRLDVVDGWGTLNIPGGSYPVLREKRTEYTTTNLDVHSQFLGWTPISSGGSGGILDFLGVDTSITYHFFSGTEKETIALLRVNNTNSVVESVTFKNNGLSDVDPIFAPGKASVNAFPNPAVDWVSFDYSNLPTNNYTLKIFNIVGKVVWKENYTLSGSNFIKVDLDNFKKGTYLYSLSDKKGNVIGTKRLVILKP